MQYDYKRVIPCHSFPIRVVRSKKYSPCKWDIVDILPEHIVKDDAWVDCMEYLGCNNKSFPRFHYWKPEMLRNADIFKTLPYVKYIVSIDFVESFQQLALCRGVRSIDRYSQYIS